MGGIPVFLYMKWRAGRDAKGVAVPVTPDIGGTGSAPLITDELMGSAR